MTAARFLSLVLAFFLGFLSCIGAIFGVGYYAYSRVSLDKLEEWGVVSVDEGQYIDEDAEVDLTAMTVKSFIDEIKRLRSLSEPVTLNLLQEQWGVKLPDEVKRVIPDGVWDVPLKEVFSTGGLTAILQNTDASYLFQFLDVSESLKESLEGKTLNDLKDYESLLSNVRLGALMGYTAVKDDPDNPDKITGWYKETPGDLDAVTEAVAKITIADITGGSFGIDTVLKDVYIGDLLKYHKGAVIPNADPLDESVRYEWTKKDEATGEYTVAVSPIERKLSNYLITDLINGRVTTKDLTSGPLHEVLNLHAVEVPLYLTSGDPLLYTADDGQGHLIGDQATAKLWYDENGNRASNTISSLAECTIDGISTQVNAVKVGGVTGLTEFESKWYKTELRNFGEGDDRTCVIDTTGILPSLADLTIGDLSDNTKVTEKTKAVTIADAMGYTKHDDVWYSTWVGAGDPGNVAVTGMMKTLAPKTVGSLSTIGDDMPIGELLGYTKVENVWYETYIDVGDPGNKKASGIMASISDFYINGLGENVKTIRIGSILELYRYASSDPLDPLYGTWYKDEACTVPADGIMANFAELTVEDMKDSNKVTEKTKSILIADAMGYQEHDGVWYSTWIAPDDPGNVRLTGMMKALAPKTVGQMSEVSAPGPNGIPVGELLGYTKVESIWYETYIDVGDPGNKEATGVIAAISDSYVDTLSDDIKNMELGKTLSLYKYNNELDPTDPNNGKWYKDRLYTEEATGVMVEFADLKIDDLSDESKVSAKSVNVVIGYAMGYSYADGVWYTDSTLSTPVTGVMKSFAPKRVGELNDVTDTKVGDVMGYTKDGGVWYSTFVAPGDPGNVKASGVIQAVADSTVGNLETDLNNTKVGKILGYTYNELELWWYDGLTKTSTIINTVSDTQLSNIGSRLSNLTVADMFSDEERASGFLSFLPASARLDELGGTGPNSMTEIFKNTTMGDYVDKGLITFSASTQAKLTVIDPSWQTRTIQQFIDHLINSVPTMP